MIVAPPRQPIIIPRRRPLFAPRRQLLFPAPRQQLYSMRQRDPATRKRQRDATTRKQLRVNGTTCCCCPSGCACDSLDGSGNALCKAGTTPNRWTLTGTGIGAFACLNTCIADSIFQYLQIYSVTTTDYNGTYTLGHLVNPPFPTNCCVWDSRPPQGSAYVDPTVQFFRNMSTCTYGVGDDTTVGLYWQIIRGNPGFLDWTIALRSDVFSVTNGGTSDLMVFMAFSGIITVASNPTDCCQPLTCNNTLGTTCVNAGGDFDGGKVIPIANGGSITATPIL